MNHVNKMFFETNKLLVYPLNALRKLSVPICNYRTTAPLFLGLHSNHFTGQLFQQLNKKKGKSYGAFHSVLLPLLC